MGQNAVGKSGARWRTAVVAKWRCAGGQTYYAKRHCGEDGQAAEWPNRTDGSIATGTQTRRDRLIPRSPLNGTNRRWNPLYRRHLACIGNTQQAGGTPAVPIPLPSQPSIINGRAEYMLNNVGHNGEHLTARVSCESNQRVRASISRYSDGFPRLCGRYPASRAGTRPADVQARRERGKYSAYV